MVLLSLFPTMFSTFHRKILNFETHLTYCQQIAKSFFVIKGYSLTLKQTYILFLSQTLRHCDCGVFIVHHTPLLCFLMSNITLGSMCMKLGQSSLAVSETWLSRCPMVYVRASICPCLLAPIQIYLDQSHGLTLS